MRAQSATPLTIISTSIDASLNETPIILFMKMRSFFFPINNNDLLYIDNFFYIVNGLFMVFNIHSNKDYSSYYNDLIYDIEHLSIPTWINAFRNASDIL